MTFIFNNLRRVADFGSKGEYNYATNDLKSAVETAGYFDGKALTMLEVGDLIKVAGDLDGTPFHSSYVVSGNDGSTVTLTEHAAVTQNVLQEVRLPDISTKASDAAVVRYVPTFDGAITSVKSVLNAALATGDATLTVAVNGSDVTDGVITATQSGSAAGDVDSATPSAANTFSAGDVITVTGGGSSTATATAGVTLQLTPS